MPAVFLRLTALCLSGGLLFFSLSPSFAASFSPAPDRHDQVLIDMATAYGQNDRRKLTHLLPQAKGHALEPWAAYWELKVRLGDAPEREIKDFLRQYEGTYQEDRLRNDWLLLLGQRQDWTSFEREWALYRMHDDKEVECYASWLNSSQKKFEGTSSQIGRVHV